MEYVKLFLDTLAQVQGNGAALLALVTLGAFALIALALVVVLTAIKRTN